MIVQRGLLRIFRRQALPATLLGVLGLTAYALLWPDVMSGRDVWPSLLIFVQCLLLAGLLGRIRSPALAFVYSRGYSRDALWSHILLASALSVLAAWLPAALIVWTGLRSALHDRVLESPYFPIMAPSEMQAPLVWLALSPLFVVAFHYTWIRSGQSTRGGSGGALAALAMLIALVTAISMPQALHGWFAWFTGIAYLAVVISFLLGGRILHRSLEVRS